MTSVTLRTPRPTTPKRPLCDGPTTSGQVAQAAIEVTLLRTLYARDHLSQVLATFALILILALPVQCLVWLASTLRHMTLPAEGPLARALRDADLPRLTAAALALRGIHTWWRMRRQPPRETASPRALRRAVVAGALLATLAARRSGGQAST